MTLEEKENKFHADLHELYKKNKHSHGDTYISDGIINYSEWEKSKVKLLFILKDPNTEGEDGQWHLSRVFEEIALGKRNHKSPTITQISKISRIFNKLCIEDYAEDFDPGLVENKYLSNCAIINIKKNFGYQRAKWQEIEEFSKIYKDKLKEQINIINPRIIFCGGFREYPPISIYSLVNEILELKEPINVLKYGKAFDVNIFRDKIILNAYHPQYQSMFIETRLACISLTKDFLNNWIRNRLYDA